MRSRAVQFTAPRRIDVVEVDVADPGEGQFVVRTEYSGISSGTESLAYRGEVDPELPLDETLGALAGTFRYPFRYGYSCVGMVEASRAAEVPEGARVFAFHPHQERFVVNESDSLVLGGEDPRTATLLPLVETALQATLDSGPRLGEVVLVTGLGAVGILTGAMLVRAGASVIGADPLSWRRDVAKGFGIQAVSPEELHDAVHDATGTRGATLLVEASGNPDVLPSVLRFLGHEGVALVCSWYGTKPVALPLGAEFHRRRLSIRSTQVSIIPAAQRDRWDRATRLRTARSLLSELPVAALATHEFPFEDAAEAYAAIDHGVDGLIHAALRYS